MAGRALFNAAAIAVPGDKRLISFRIAHDPSGSPSASPRSSPGSSPGKWSSRAADGGSQGGGGEARSGETAPDAPSSAQQEAADDADDADVGSHFASESSAEESTAHTPRGLFDGASGDEGQASGSDAGDSSGLVISELHSRNRRLEALLLREKAATSALRGQLADARRATQAAHHDALEARREAVEARREAAHEKACSTEAAWGLEREAELAWAEAEAWVAHEERLEQLEVDGSWVNDRGGDGAHPGGDSPRSNFSGRSGDRVSARCAPWGGASGARPPLAPRRGDAEGEAGWARPAPLAAAAPRPVEDDDDDDDSWAIALHQHAQLHEKLSSPKRQPPSPAETQKRQDERQTGAERNRERLQDQRAQKLSVARDRGEGVRARTAATAESMKEEMRSRHARAGTRHAAFLDTVRRRAVRESAKVDEAAFINSLTSFDVQADLQRRLNAVEARIEEARKRRDLRLDGVRSKQTKRHRRREEQASAQRVARAEAAQQRWEQLQARLAAVEQRRESRLQSMRNAARDAANPAAAHGAAAKGHAGKGPKRAALPPRPTGLETDDERNSDEESGGAAALRRASAPAKRSLPSPPRTPPRRPPPPPGRKKTGKRKANLLPKAVDLADADDADKAVVSSAFSLLRWFKPDSDPAPLTSTSAEALNDAAAAALLACAEAVPAWLKRVSANEGVLECGALDLLCLAWTLRRWLRTESHCRPGASSAKTSDLKPVRQRSLVAAAAMDVAATLVEFQPGCLNLGPGPGTAFLHLVPDVASAAAAVSPVLAASALSLVAALARRPPRDSHDFFFAGDRACAAAVVSALVESCLTPPASPTADSPAVAALPQLSREAWRVALNGLRALNGMARLDHAALVGRVFSTSTLQPQLLSLCDHLFVAQARLESPEAALDAAARAGRAVASRAVDDVAALAVDEVVELAGHVALRNQECVQWGSASRVTILHRLVTLPFRYFHKAAGRALLFPTLVAACLDNDRNASVVARDLALKDVADFCRQHWPPRDAPDALQRIPSPLEGRVPPDLCARAAAYFDKAHAEVDCSPF
ncbi:hypothetical protein M885DRAFT_508952 [Pelagophyceae sp. CCMP2097]|nr:hypothetical protein M885DRAFT_508952 [Pelagophyceae sp. CCMP2097]